MESLLESMNPSKLVIGKEFNELELRSSLTRCMKETVALNREITSELDRLLFDRLHRIESRRSLVLCVAAFAVILSVYLLGGIFLTISKTVEIMKNRITQAMVKGDFSMQLEASSRDELGEVAGMFNTLAQRLHTSEQFNLATIDALSAHVAVLDEAGNIVATNQAWREFAKENDGKSPAVTNTGNYLAVCDAAAASGNADAAVAARSIRQVISGERSQWFFEYPCHGPQEQRWFYCRVTRFKTNNSIHVVIAHENISEMRQAQELLASSRALFESLEHASPVGIVRADSNGRCIGANDRFLEQSGMRLDAVLGNGWLDCVHSDDRERVSEECNEMVRSGEPLVNEFRIQHHWRSLLGELPVHSDSR